MHELMRRLGFRFRPFWWWGSDTVAAEVISAVAAWGALVAMIFKSLSTSGEAVTLVVPYWGWAILFLGQAVLQSASMCGNVRAFRDPAAVVGIVFWGFLAMTGVILEGLILDHLLAGVLALANLWVLSRRHDLNVPGAGTSGESAA